MREPTTADELLGRALGLVQRADEQIAGLRALSAGLKQIVSHATATAREADALIAFLESLKTMPTAPTAVTPKKRRLWGSFGSGRVQ